MRSSCIITQVKSSRDKDLAALQQAGVEGSWEGEPTLAICGKLSTVSVTASVPTL